MQLKLIISLILMGLAVVFIVQNVTVVEIRFLFWKFAMSRSLFMFMLLTVGILVGWFLHGYHNYKQKTKR